MSLYDYCAGDPVNGLDPDGRFGKAVANYIYAGGPASSGLNSLSSLSDSLADYGVNHGNGFLAGVGGAGSSLFGTLATLSSPEAIANGVSSSYSANLAMFDGSHYDAINATFNPAYMGMVGFTEAGTGSGLSASNFGQQLNGLERTQSFFQGVSGTAGTVSLGLGGGSLYRLGMNALTSTAAESVAPDIAATFSGGKFTSTVLQDSMTAYRYSGGVSGATGRFLTTADTVSQISSPAAASIALKLPVGATAEALNTFTIPAGTRIFTGGVAGGADTATQIFIENPGVLIPH